MEITNNNFLAHSLENADKWHSLTFKTDNYTAVAPHPGVISFLPTKQSNTTKSIILSCGVHGNETAPIEICNDIVKDLLDEKIHLEHRVLFLFGNLPAMKIAERFVEENLNRLFSHEVNSDSLEGKRAKVLMREVDEFFDEDQNNIRFHYDLHTAIRASKNEKFAVYPFLHGKQHNKRELAFLSSCDVNTILLSQSPTTTFSYFSSHNYNAHAFTVELGKVKPFGQNDMSKFAKVDEMLRKLLNCVEIELPDFNECPLEIYTVNQVINKQHNDFKLHFADDAPNFSDFKKGDIFASEPGKEYRATVDGEAIVFPNANVPIGQRALLTVRPYEL